MLSVGGSATNLRDQRREKLVMSASRPIAHVAGPRWMIGLVSSLSEVTLDGARDLGLVHGVTLSTNEDETKTKSGGGLRGKEKRVRRVRGGGNPLIGKRGAR